MARPKSSGLPKAVEEQLRLTQLLDIAAEVFFEVGYEAASTAEIAARAHSSKRALYSRFSSKEELFLAVIDHRTSKIADRVTELFQEERPIRPLLLDVARELLRSLLSDEHTALIRLVYAQAPQFPQAAEFMTERGPDRGIAKIAAHLKEQARRGTLSISDSQLAAQQFAGLLVGDLIHQALLRLDVPRSQKAMEARAQSAVEAFLKIYGAA
ncbi:MAG: TetR/AcrR family transcriptional regulator [Edaphobacter sp.]|uniref:TetR/AcrR family transcriptional regulator n=1 Tax=Edaphobacter sp. TaxID=1934404 RepID=UPI00238AD2B0|nr:TetR/AcrR family transcriptional regulator [Edaphobacter sp.]MDE1175593.1 TetR/AcrR family transcriptional regulator [Edaphobacter sp.]